MHLELNKALAEYDYEKLKNDKKELEKINKNAVLLESAVKMLQKQQKEQQKKISILDNVPCGDQFLSCRFLVDAAKERELLPKTEKELLENEVLLKEVEEKIKNDQTLKHINKFEELRIQSTIKNDGLLFFWLAMTDASSYIKLNRNT